MKLRSQKETNSKKEKKKKRRRKTWEYLHEAKQRQVCYCKRKRGLMRKVIQLFKLTGCQGYLILVEKKKIFEFSPGKEEKPNLKFLYPDIESVTRVLYDRYTSLHKCNTTNSNYNNKDENENERLELKTDYNPILHKNTNYKRNKKLQKSNSEFCNSELNKKISC